MRPNLIALAVKPQDLPKVYSDIGGSFDSGKSLMSIVAGATMTSLANGMKHDGIIRVMPNTPAQIGEGMTMWTCASSVSVAHREATDAMLSTIGDAIYVDDEKYLDMATALSASGPAYVFLIVEALIDAGVYVGLPRDVSRRLALQTIKGSVQLVSETGRHPGELKDMVTSPGGTTAEGLQALERAGVPAALVDAVNAAYLKSVRLGPELGSRVYPAIRYASANQPIHHAVLPAAAGPHHPGLRGAVHDDAGGTERRRSWFACTTWCFR